MSNHSVRTAQIVVFFVMTPCDSAGALKRIQCWHTLGNIKYLLIQKSPFSIPVLTSLSPPLPQINFEDQKIHNIGNNCVMPIDGTNLWIPQTGEANTGNWFASHKSSEKLALRFKIGGSNRGGPGMDPGFLPSSTLQ